MTDDPPELGEIMQFPDGQAEGDKRWLVLFDGDYHNHAVDVEGNVGVLVDIEQAGEVLSLASEAIADLSAKDAEGDDVIRSLIDALEREVDDDV